MTETVAINSKRLEHFVHQVFANAGVPDNYAHIIAESLVQADLRGVDSHGVVRTKIYLERLEAGMVDPHADVEVVTETEAMALIDGHNNFGAVIGSKALDLSLQRSKQYGASIVGVKHSNHFGTCAYFALKAVQQDCALLVMSNASQTMPPTGGIRPFIGTNPLAVGVPAGEELPFILDMATSVVARGKIIVSAQKDESIPHGWAIDKDGNPTTDPNKALVGSVLPVGGAKGYGLSMFIDILSGVLTGAGYGKYVNNMYENWQQPQNVGHLFIAIDINRFLPIDLFKARMDMYIRELKAEPKAPGVQEILIPGEIEHRLTIERQLNGILLPAKLIQELKEIGERYGVNFP
ncbi:MAG: putative oxidoreductase YjmC [Paenibacillus sp.]|jgi:LDH2 family malate/lactate/ureidoglycolate dehydrogenase|nr:putative oxidoreductase YjmC [Paenibacillus sp.]